MTIGEIRDYVRVLLHSYYTTITGWGVLRSDVEYVGICHPHPPPWAMLWNEYRFYIVVYYWEWKRTWKLECGFGTLRKGGGGACEEIVRG